MEKSIQTVKWTNFVYFQYNRNVFIRCSSPEVASNIALQLNKIVSKNYNRDVCHWFRAMHPCIYK